MIELIWYGLAIVASLPVIAAAVLTTTAFREYFKSLQIIKEIKIKRLSG